MDMKAHQAFKDQLDQHGLVSFNVTNAEEGTIAKTMGVKGVVRLMSMARIECSKSLRQFGVVGFEVFFESKDGQFYRIPFIPEGLDKPHTKKCLQAIFKSFEVVRYVVAMDANANTEMKENVVIGGFDGLASGKAWLFQGSKLKRNPFENPSVPTRFESYWSDILSDQKGVNQ